MGTVARRIPMTWLVGLILALGSSFGPSPIAIAQEAAIECAPAAPSVLSPAASPAATTATTEAPFPEEGSELVVFAAASLTDAFNQIKADLEAAEPGLTITYNFAGSQALVTQLTQGAEADVFVSANTEQMTAAIEAGVIAGEAAILAQNRLAIVVPADNPADIQDPADLATDGLKLVMAAPEVPVGRYSRESVCAMGADAATYGEGFVDGVAGNIVSNEDNVKAVLAKVQLGEADAGIVYTTDVTADVAEDVVLIDIPAAVNVIAQYPIAPVAEGDAALAEAFIAYVIGPEGQATLAQFGFEPVP
ncbi:MAG: molybdate ABC transporter substrate-binding protein [Thermomicrobiales bacterium]